ncbi:hypothetical protein Aperf_G00000071366 [Anoplocephala perfoliata]
MEYNEATTDPGGDPPRSPVKLKSSLLGHRESDLRKSKKIGHRRVTDQGTVTYKKTPTSEIQRAIQLGIQHSIGSLQQKPVRDVLFRDFEVIETVDFPRSGTKTTPAHGLSDFRFRTVAPVAFRSFRDQFKLDIRDYLRIQMRSIVKFLVVLTLELHRTHLFATFNRVPLTILNSLFTEWPADLSAFRLL